MVAVRCVGRGCGRQDNKLNTYDWLADIPGNSDEQEMVEVQFKNTRKDIIATPIACIWRKEIL